MYWFCVVCQCTIVYSNSYTVSQSDIRTLEHNHHLALMLDIGSCLQQLLDYVGVSMISSYLQRSTAILYESMRDKTTVTASGDREQRIERERERERERESERERERERERESHIQRSRH